MVSDLIGVALTKTACPVCGHTKDGDIVINKRLSAHMANKVKSLHGKVTGFEVCQECRETVQNGFVRLVECDEEKSKFSQDGTMKPENAYRTGRIFDVKNEAYSRLFSANPPLGGFSFIDKELGDLLAGMIARVPEMHEMTDEELSA